MRKTLIIILLAIPTLLLAQNNNEKARQQIQKLAGLIQSYKNIRIEFTYNLENKESKINENRDGTMWISGNRYRLMIAGQIIVNDGKSLYTYMPDAQEVQINEVSADDDNLSPLAIITGYEKKYRIKYIREENKRTMVVDLTPNEGKKFYKIRLEIDTHTNQLMKFSLHDRSGSVYSYLIRKFEVNRDIQTGYFTFNPADYPGIEVVDLR
jgi:outer membrane lipoprotein-sorting protein